MGKKKHFELFPADEFASNTLTTIKNTKNISVSELNKALGERGKVISNGYGDFKDITFRIAHMAETRMDEILVLLKDIEEILGL